MTFTPKKIKAKVTGGDPFGFNPMNSGLVISSFKLKGKKFKSVPKGFLAIQPKANMIFAGFDYNRDGVIDVTYESFTQFQVQIDPFAAKSATEKLADKFSKPKAKGKLIFKPFEFQIVDEDALLFEGFLDKNKLQPMNQMSEGYVINDSFQYDAFVDTLFEA